MICIREYIGKFIIILFLIFAGFKLQAQQLVINEITPACNNDGVLSIEIPPQFLGGILTWNFDGENFSGSATVTSSPYIFSNYSGRGVYFLLSLNGITSTYSYFTHPPFWAYGYGVSAVCPELTGFAVANAPDTTTYSIEWLNTDNAVVGNHFHNSLPLGHYGYIITSPEGCVVSALPDAANPDTGVYIGMSSNIYAQIPTTPAFCTNGSASVINPSGGIPPYSYAWQNGANTSSLNNLSAGSYSVVIIDAQGCSSELYAYVQQAIALNVNSTAIPATCVESDGGATVYATNGTAPYTYHWSNGVIGNTITNVPSGNYSVQVTDAAGCTGQGYVSVASSTPVTATFSSTPSECTTSTGTATLGIQGGVAPYNIVWSTFPIQTGSSISNVPPGNYTFNIADQNGCTRSGQITVPPISLINANMSVTPTHCALNNGTAAISASGSGPFTFLWSNNSTATVINGLDGGVVSCLITDANGCMKTKQAYVEELSPLEIAFNVTPTSCIFFQDGIVEATAVGGIAPYVWSSGSNIISGLAPGMFGMHVTDAQGCQAMANTVVPAGNTDNSCYCTIQGTVFEDLNDNCVQDNGEDGLPNVRIDKLNDISKYTDFNGNYSFIVPSGEYYIIENTQGDYTFSACQQQTQPVTVTAASGCIAEVNFGNSIIPRHEINVLSFAWAPPVPGNDYQQTVVYTNSGTHPETEIEGNFEHDGQLLFLGNSPYTVTQPDQANFPFWYSHTADIPDLNPGESMVNYLNFTTPTNIPLGTAVVIKDSASYSAPVSSWVDDHSPWNNVVYFSTIVVGAFDPNFKEVSPQGYGATGAILPSDTVLTYLVHFQNTGTAPASLVVIRDTLDSDLEFTSLRPGWASHHYETAVTADGVIEFRFPNINLPDSSVSQLGSMGVVSYSIHMKTNRPLGTQITNDAAIYFDYNPPIFTNTTLNTIELEAALKENKQPEMSFKIYPNPANDFVQVEIESAHNGASPLTIFDISGRLIYKEQLQLLSGKNILTIPISRLENGIYLVKSGKNSVRKLSVSR